MSDEERAAASPRAVGEVGAGEDEAAVTVVVGEHGRGGFDE
jgi:hypothetical protein